MLVSGFSRILSVSTMLMVNLLVFMPRVTSSLLLLSRKAVQKVKLVFMNGMNLQLKT